MQDIVINIQRHGCLNKCNKLRVKNVKYISQMSANLPISPAQSNEACTSLIHIITTETVPKGSNKIRTQLPNARNLNG
jgi:hypothetical protein